MRKLLVVVAAITLGVATSIPASAQPPPSCSPGATSACTLTIHFTDPGTFVAPIDCPPDSGLYLFSGTGEGVAHLTINAAFDSWFTMTFEGTARLDPILPDNTSDASRQSLAGHIAVWDGASFNNQNYVLHDTANFKGATVSGPARTVDLHIVDHASSVPPNNMPPPIGPPTNAHTIFSTVSC